MNIEYKVMVQELNFLRKNNKKLKIKLFNEQKRNTLLKTIMLIIALITIPLIANLGINDIDNVSEYKAKMDYTNGTGMWTEESWRAYVQNGGK